MMLDRYNNEGGNWRTGRRKRQTTLTHEQILQTAAAEFSRLGFFNTSMDDLSRILGVSKPTLYTFFKHKKDLLAGCQEAARQLVKDAFAGLDGQEDMSSAVDLLITRFKSLLSFSETRHFICVSLKADEGLQGRAQGKPSVIEDFEKDLRGMLAKYGNTPAEVEVQAASLAAMLMAATGIFHRNGEGVGIDALAVICDAARYAVEQKLTTA